VRVLAEVTVIGELRAAGEVDAHHIIQHAAVRDLPGYSESAAPGLRLEGSSTRSDLVITVQRRFNGRPG
jgi:hypothetical protein